MKHIVKWNGLVDTFRDEMLGEYLVVRRAVGKAPWGGWVKAEITEDGETILVSLLPSGSVIAVLPASKWEIWITPKNEIHVVRSFPKPDGSRQCPPDEYLFISYKIEEK